MQPPLVSALLIDRNESLSIETGYTSSEYFRMVEKRPNDEVRNPETIDESIKEWKNMKYRLVQ